MAKIRAFRKSKLKIWEQLAEELGGRFVKGKGLKKDKVMARHREWVISLDHFVRSSGNTHIPMTRIRAPYVNRDDFIFRIYRKGLFPGIGKLFGVQDIVIGYPEFDDPFIIQGNDEKKLRMLFDHQDIRDLISFQPRIKMLIQEDGGWFKEKFPEGVNELYFEAVGIISNLAQLHDLFELFAITLDHLCDIGTAYEDRPPFK